MSPDDYRRQAGFRRSTAVGRVIPHASWAYEENPLGTDLVAADLTDPRLAVFLGGGRMTAAGVAVGERLALRNSTFFRAISLISGAIGMLPVHLMRRMANGDTQEATEHPLHAVLKRKPNGYQTAFEFKSYMQATALLDGNAYAMVVRGVGGKIVALIPLKRGTVTPILSDTYELTFRYDRANGGPITLAADEVFHFRSIVSLDGLRGVSLLDVAAEALGIAVQAERAAGRLFRNGVMAGGALEVPNELDDVPYERLRSSLEERYSGSENAQRWMILEQGIKANTFTTSAKDSQFLEIREHQAEEMSRFTGAPRPLLMFDETSWGSGIETLGQFFVTYCLAPWFVAWEQAIERCLGPAEQGVLYPKFNEGALLRGSLKDQADFFAKALGNVQAWMTPDEVRANFDQNKIAGGEKLPVGGKAAAPPPDPDPLPAPAKEPAK